MERRSSPGRAAGRSCSGRAPWSSCWARNAAELGRECIFEYIAKDNPRAALELDEQFDDKAERAARSPGLYRPGRIHGPREIVVCPSYVMIDRVRADAVTILRILHTAQQWPPAEPESQ